MKFKVILIHNTIAPYRHPLFEELSKHVDLTVYYCSVRHSYRKWELWPRKYLYKWKILPRIPIKLSNIELNLNLTIIMEIIKNRPHAVIIGGYVDPTMWLAFATSKILKIPVIYWTEGIREPRTLVGKLTRPFRILFIKKSKAIVVPGRLSKHYVVTLGANANKVFIAPNAIDNKLFEKISNKFKPLKKELNVHPGFKNKIIILYVGQLIKRKGVEYLLHSYKKLKQENDNVKLIIVGSGPLKFYLKDLADSLKLKDFKIIPSGLTLQELIKLYSISDIFVLPTLEDVWGFVVNEAMACGLPVVATRASQAALEMIRHGENGYIVKEADSEELYRALKKLVLDEKLRMEMGRKSRIILKRYFSINSMASGFIQAIIYALLGRIIHRLNRWNSDARGFH